MAHVFTYGSLMFPQVWNAVVQGRHDAQRATLAGFSRHALRARDYPGIVAHPNGSVQGVLYFDVSDSDLGRLDRFEGDEYRRIDAEAQLQPSGSLVPASAYLYVGTGLLFGQAWMPEAFLVERFLAANPPACVSR